LALQLGIADAVSLPGFSTNPIAFLVRANLSVLSSIYEGLANVLIEALACGCPVVSTDCPSGPAEILEQGRYGPLVPVGDDVALADAMQAVLRNRPDSEVLKARGHLFTTKRAVDCYGQLVERLRIM
jgi:glycosyltransferase involved in cell wall biosynthesis